jgi:hypothetical protein
MDFGGMRRIFLVGEKGRKCVDLQKNSTSQR